jgi:hypothetical protein
MVPEKLIGTGALEFLVMIIRLIWTVTLSLALFVGDAAMAQASEPVSQSSNEMQQARALLNAGREDIVREEIRFSDEESAAFWPLYERYQADLQIVRDRYAELLGSYLDAYRAGNVSEEMANQIIDDYLQIQVDRLNIKKEYLSDFRKVLPARKAARFYQLENKIQLGLESQLSTIVPLIDPV